MTNPVLFQALLDYGEQGLSKLKANPDKKNTDFFFCTYFPTVFKAFSGLTSLLENFGMGDSNKSKDIEKIFLLGP